MVAHPRFSLIINIGLLLLVAVLVFQSSDIAKYEAHRQFQHPTVVGEQSFLSDVEIRVSPGKEDWMLAKIDTATRKTWINVYTFTLPGLRESLLRAQKRGVDVRVLVEKNPYNTVTINRETIEFLRENNIPFHESTEKQFAFMHAKYMIIDHEWIIETANWTRSSFSTNREFFVIGEDVGVLRTLIEIFQQDFLGGKGESHDVRVLAGPTNARERLGNFLDRTEQKVDIYAPSLSDETLINHLTKLCHSGVKVRILMSDYEENKTVYDECLQRRTMRKPLHAKVILSDGVEAFVGSFNYTQNSLENNREVGIFLNGEEVFQMRQVFENDWIHSEVALKKK